MKRIKASDFKDYPFSAEIIFQVLADIPGYKNWWPNGVKVKVLKKTTDDLNSMIEVWATGGWFRCRTTALNPPYRVCIQYFAGVVLGESYWTIEPLGNGMTKVGYTIDLEPHGLFPCLISIFVNISTLHSLQFKRVLHNLHKHLESLTYIQLE